MTPAKHLNEGRRLLHGVSPQQHTHSHHSRGATLQVTDLHQEPVGIGIGDVEPSSFQTVNHLLLVVDVEEIISQELMEGEEEEGEDHMTLTTPTTSTLTTPIISLSIVFSLMSE